MIHEITGDVMHVPSKTTNNKFLIVGVHYADDARLPGQDVLGFRLLEENRVDYVVEILPRVTDAAVEWKNQETVGVLHLKLKPPTTTAEAQADAQSGGRERAMPIKDMQRDLTKDKDLRKSATQTKTNESVRTPERTREVAPPPPPPPPGMDMF
jgi:hypothetical protein